MREKWYAVVDRDSGAAVSFGTELGEDIADSLEVIEIDRQPGPGEMWDTKARRIVDAPAPAPHPLAEAYARANSTDAKLDAIASALGLK